MIGRDLEQLHQMRGQVEKLHQRLANRVPFQHPRISLPVEEAIKCAAELEGWLHDIIDTVEAELYHGPLTKE